MSVAAKAGGAAAAAILALVLAGGAAAYEPGDVVRGLARADSGNKLTVHKTPVYLAGILAPEPRQKCRAGAFSWLCGAKARQTLDALVAGEIVTCRIRFTPWSEANPDRDNQPEAPLPRERPAAECETDRHHLNATLVERGLAHPRPGSEGRRYLAIAELARQAKRGIWQGP